VLLGLGLFKTLNSVWERAESRKAPEALQKRVWGVEEENRPEGLWGALGQEPSVLKR